MITKITIENFKRFDSAEVELGSPVVFVGPNNSGKSTALQALALWNLGLKRWNEKRAGKAVPKNRPGVTINRRDLVAVPVPTAKLLWHDLHVRNTSMVEGRQKTDNVYLTIVVEGVNCGRQWSFGLEFYYANEESFYCRPTRPEEGSDAVQDIPDEVGTFDIAFLPPMSGLVPDETRLDPGAINVRIGEGRTAEVLRNLCYGLANRDPAEGWESVRASVKRLFGIELGDPVYVQERGEVIMKYREPSGVELDLACSGRGLQQVLLLLAYIHLNPRSVLLLDEPDAHLEILRQRQIYQVLTEEASSNECQVVMASHSEVLLNEAADRDVVVAFVGAPHRIDDRGAQVAKALKQIGFEQYYQAEQCGWVLYVEGSTDLAILRAFAQRLGHQKGVKALESPFVHYVENKVQAARNHFYGLREAKPELTAFALFDQLETVVQSEEALEIHQWRRKEIENYLCDPQTLKTWAEEFGRREFGELFSQECVSTMRNAIEDIVPRVALRDLSDQWWLKVKASDQYLDRVFEQFFERLQLPNLMRKTDYHVLAAHVARNTIPAEVGEVLDRIAHIAENAVR